LATVVVSMIFILSGCNGDQGNAGQGCIVADNGNGWSTITCGDTSVTVKNGDQGEPGAGGSSCTIVSNGDGTRTITCTDGTSVTVPDTFVDMSTMPTDELKALELAGAVTGVTVPADGRPEISFKLIDRKGTGVRGMTAGNLRVSLLKLTTGVNDSANDTWVSYMANNATSTASTETAADADFTDLGDGTYTYKFTKQVTDSATAGTTYEPAKPHRLILLVYAAGNPYVPLNIIYDFIPDTSTDVTGQYEKVDPKSCDECHSTFRAKVGGSGGISSSHSGSYDLRTCVACHNDQRRFSGSEPAIGVDGTWTGSAALVNGEAYTNLPVFIHKIHMGDELNLKGGSYQWFARPQDVTYPQDVRSCAKCHRAVAQADHWKSAPSSRACGACHDNIWFKAAPVPLGRQMHSGGTQTDATCATCHNSADIAAKHVAIVTPASEATWLGGTTADANAGWIPAAGMVPSGASVISYDVASVSRDASKHPVVVFMLKKDGAPVTFNTYQPGVKTELMDDFVGSPSVVVAFAVPQDGIAAPVDFNATTSAYIKGVWNGSAPGTMTGPDASGYYTMTLTGVTVPDNATMLTGGVGYTYSLSGAQPLTQINLSAYPATLVLPNISTSGTATTGMQGSMTCTATAPCTCTAAAPCMRAPAGGTSTTSGTFTYGRQWNGTATLASCTTATPCTCTAGQPCFISYSGGVTYPAPNIWKVATGYTGRRTIISNDNCNSCHAAMGANPTFHAGQRNDGPTCAFCHTPNLTSSAWSANAKDFIHALHAAQVRSNPFMWAAASPTNNFANVTYPGVLNNCEQCHLAGTYDLSAAASQSAVPNMLPSTVATGSFSSASSSVFAYSPFVQVDTAYGSGFSFDAATGITTQAASTTLIVSPITAACSACHDSPAAHAHMTANGGTFYEPRSTALAKTEQCLICHGPGRSSSIADVHR